MAATDSRAKELIQQFGQLKKDRETWESLWEDYIAYLAPRRGFMTSGTNIKPTKADKPDYSKILNPAATLAVTRLAAGMQSGLTSPMKPWFRLTLMDEDMAQLGAVKAWLQAVERRMYAAFAGSNFYAAVHSTFGELPVFGTAAMYAGESRRTIINFKPLTIGEYWIASGPDGNVDTVARQTWWTAKEMVQTWGKACPPAVIDQHKTNPYEYFKVLHMVQPRRSGDSLTYLDADAMPFESVWLAFDDEVVLEEGGFRAFPYMVSRWDTTGSEVWGRGAAEDMLPDIKMLQELEKTQLKALHKMADPPLLLPNSLKNQPINVFPGGMTFTDSGGKDAASAFYQVDFDVANVEAKIQGVVERIAQGFFNDVFLMLLQRPNMTATEVLERAEEKILMLGPVIERQQSELLDPVIQRAFDILWNRGRNLGGQVVNEEEVLLPDPPQEIAGQPLKVEYIGLLAQAQRMAGADGLNRFMQVAMPVVQASPETMDKLDLDQALDEYAHFYGVPVEVVRADDVVEALRASRAQAQAQAQQMAMAQQQAQTAQTLSQADLSTPNALTAVVQQQAQEAA